MEIWNVEFGNINPPALFRRRENLETRWVEEYTLFKNKTTLIFFKMKVEYKRNRRSKNIRITVKSASEVLVTYPWWSNQKTAEKFVAEKRGWIEKALERHKNNMGGVLMDGNRQDYLKNKERARRLVYVKLKQFNDLYGFNYKRVAIRDQKTRWGSCSGDGNLNFSYRIVYLPEDLVDYLIVHELCHLKELNHSRAFWSLVGQVIPNYRSLSRKLRKT